MDNITLIGMPGSGKSAIGKALAERLGYEFVDGDELIESSGRKLQDIIDKDGDKSFCRIEEKALLGLKGRKKVFSPGGSCVLSPKAMRHLKKISLIVYIDVPFKIIKKRLENEPIDARGIVGLKRMGLKELNNFRKPLYLKYSDLVISLGNQPVEKDVEAVMSAIKNLKK